jgi:hypothetical protein
LNQRPVSDHRVAFCAPETEETNVDATRELQDHERYAAVAVFETDEQARFGLESLREAGVPEDRISIVGRGEEAPQDEGVSPVAPESETARGIGRGSLLGGAVGLVVAIAVPGGVVLGSGLLAAMAASGAIFGGSLGMIGQLGVPETQVAEYEEDLSAGRYLVIVHGTSAEVGAAYEVLVLTDNEELDLFA